jgi:FKBP-type peptidyl-prolyl cis-trans isomerase
MHVRNQSSPRLFVFASLSLVVALGSVGCAKLTAPSNEEPVTVTKDPVGEPEKPAANGADPHDPHAANPHGDPHGEKAKPSEPEKPKEPEKPLEKKDLAVGKGPEAKAGDLVSVHYVGTLPDGKEFDASRKRGKPFEFQLGQGNVIKGWDQGVVGMKPGGKRKLVIPASLGYGARGAPPLIPPFSPLVFEVELLEIKKKP